VSTPLWLRFARLDHALRPLWAQTLPANWTAALYSASRSRFLSMLSDANLGTVAKAQHPVTVMGIPFRNDLGNAAGVDKDGSLLNFHHALGAGFAVVGTVLDAPHTGNLWSPLGMRCNPWTPLPQSGGALNSLGLPSKGIDVALDTIKRFQDEVQPEQFPIGLSIMGHPAKEGEAKLRGIVECVRKATGVVDFIEINESCPNVQHEQGDVIGRLRLLVEARDEAGSTPLLVKLAEIHQPETLIPGLLEAGVRGLVATNTQNAYEAYAAKIAKGDARLFRYYTNTHAGGLSGRPIAGFAAQQIEQAKQHIPKGADFSLVHVGGIESPEDVDRSRKIAELREWYTGFFERLILCGPATLYRDMTQR